MEFLNNAWSAIKTFFTIKITKESLLAVITPAVDKAWFFYWGFLMYVFANIFVTDFVSVIMVAVMVLVVQLILYAYKGRKLSITDYIFAFLPTLITSIHIWI